MKGVKVVSAPLVTFRVPQDSIACRKVKWRFSTVTKIERGVKGGRKEGKKRRREREKKGKRETFFNRMSQRTY